MGYQLFLDDERVPYSVNNTPDAFYYMRDVRYINLEWEIVRNYDDFVKIISERGMPDLLSFDHDLGDTAYLEWIDNTQHTGVINYNNITEKTGYDCVKWLVEYCMDRNLDFPEYMLHTGNGVGKKNMKSYIENFNKSRSK